MNICYYSAFWYYSGDYSWILDTTERIQHSFDHQAVNTVGPDGWRALKNCDNNQTLLWDTVDPNSIFGQIKKNMYRGHTPESGFKSFKILKFIAKNGWYRYVWLCLWNIKTSSFYKKLK